MWWNVVTVSLRQRITPDHLLGRLNAAYRFFGWGAGPLGALAGGLIAEIFGIPAVFLLAVIISLAMIWVRRSLTDPALEAAEMAAAPAAESGVSMSATGAGALGPNYLRLWSSSAVSNLADGIFVVALPLIAVQLTSSPMLVAGVSLAGRLPWLVFVLVAGALADRLDRRVTMRNVQLMRVAVVGLMAAMALTDTLSLPVLYVAAFALGVGETLFDTAAQSIMPNIVGADLLSRANSRLYAVELTMNMFVGPPLGGFLVALSVPVALGGSVTRLRPRRGRSRAHRRLVQAHAGRSAGVDAA